MLEQGHAPPVPGEASACALLVITSCTNRCRIGLQVLNGELQAPPGRSELVNGNDREVWHQAFGAQPDPIFPPDCESAAGLKSFAPEKRLVTKSYESTNSGEK